MASAFAWLRASHGSLGDANTLFTLARNLEAEGDMHTAATAYDRAYGLNPDNEEIERARNNLLEQLAISEYGIKFRYIPAGSFLMGSATGDPDEQPVHPVELDRYWLSETPVSWSAYCDLMDWEPPPLSRPRGSGTHYQGMDNFHLLEANKIRLQYCEDATVHARDWHAHAPEHNWIRGGSEVVSSRVLFGEPAREDPRRPWRYNRKPMVSVSWQEAEELCEKISTLAVLYRLPREAEWEKAARGGLINQLFAWGSQPPTDERCDFNRFNDFSILPMRRFAPNGYGLYSMCGGVWEWTADWYDAQYYGESPTLNPTGPASGQEKALRSGSWADGPEAVTVSFRMSRSASSWRNQEWGGHFSPNIGFRLCRVEVEPAS
jgi:formylglycine-generating enzyme